MSKTLLKKVKGRSIEFLILLLTVGIAYRAHGQDIHYTQFYNAPFQVSPSQIGLFDGYIRVQGNYRNQWRTVPVGYETVTLAVDKKFPSKSKYQFFAGGLVFNYDQAGFSELNHTQIQFLGSFTRRTGNNTYLTLGGIFSMNQRAFNVGELTFDRQYNGVGGVDPNIDPNEDFPNLSNNYGNVALGINFRFQDKDKLELVDKLEKRNKLDLGVGVFNLNTPNQSLLEDADVPLPVRLSPYVFGTLQLDENFDFVGSFLAQFQTTYRELNYGAALKWHVNRNPGKQLAFQLGVNFRSHDFGESWSPTAEINFNNWRAGFSYEVNTSGFQIATNRDSGPEFSLRYIFKRVEPLPKYKICPLI